MPPNPDFFLHDPVPSPVAAPAHIPASPAGSMAPPPAAAQLQSGRSFRAAAQPAVEAAAERENDDGLGRSADSAPPVAFDRAPSLPEPRLIQQESYWTYKAPPTPVEAPPGMAGDWQSLSPGMRREIWRSYERLQTPASDAAPQHDHRREYLDRKAAVQIAARERL